ncbi:hypothetical protein FACS1894133_1230 [Clostridia bacterium]|nr:hypothetical protein FACS1894133_1230 [Clostridia bacterium]
MDNFMTLAAASGTLGVVEIDPGTIVFTLINTIVIALMYYFFLHKKVVKMLEQRAEEINGHFDEAEAIRAKAAETEREYTEKLKLSKAEAAEILAKASRLGEEEGRLLVEEAKRHATQIKENAEAEIVRDSTRANEELKNKFADLVLDAANAVVAKEIRRTDNELIIDEFLQKI